MAASVKTLLENPGELYWGTHHDDPEYHYGIALDYRNNTLIAQAVYVLTDFADEAEKEPLVTPDVLTSCFTVADLEANNVVLSDNMDDEDAVDIKGWYCIELSVFKRDELETLQESSSRFGGYLDIVTHILQVTPDNLEGNIDFLEECDFFDLQEQLGGISDLIDNGVLRKPLPFQFHLVGDALLGWQTANEEDFR